ncbi:MAG: dephospho-CoA kinase [Lachnospiraceae bacterium]|nr:dephospho-CoA kinase [Lachnospiraceae bacterium]
MIAEYVIGIIGGIGTGKSTVLGILRDKYGAAIIEADAVGHDLMRQGEKLYQSEVALIGKEILDASGEIDRKNLGAVVFADKEKLKLLNDMAHPAIRDEIARRLAVWRADENWLSGSEGEESGDSACEGKESEGKVSEGKVSEAKVDEADVSEAKVSGAKESEAECPMLRLAVLEAALPEEAGLPGFCDRIWTVTAPLETRIERLMTGRGYTREKCIGIISNQRSDEEFEAMADALIDNGGEYVRTEHQLDVLVKELIPECV